MKKRYFRLMDEYDDFIYVHDDISEALRSETVYIVIADPTGKSEKSGWKPGHELVIYDLQSGFEDTMEELTLEELEKEIFIDAL